MATIEIAVFLAFGQGRAVGRRRIKGGYARTPGPDPFGECSLRDDLQIDLSCRIEILENGRAGRARKGAHHLADAPGLDQERQTVIAGTGVVADKSEVLQAQIPHCIHELLRYAGIPKATHQYSGPVLEIATISDGVSHALHAFIDQ